MTPPTEERRDGMQELKNDVKLILKIINGNGRIGMSAKVNLMWRWGGVVCVAIVTASIVQTIIAIGKSLSS